MLKTIADVFSADVKLDFLNLKSHFSILRYIVIHSCATSEEKAFRKISVKKSLTRVILCIS